MSPSTIRIVCALLAIILLAVLIMRRRKHAE
jgi:hypothetical protein